MMERTIILCTEVVLRVRDGLEVAEGYTDDDILNAIGFAAEAHITDQCQGTQPVAPGDFEGVAEDDESIGTFEVRETWSAAAKRQLKQPQPSPAAEVPCPSLAPGVTRRTKTANVTSLEVGRQTQVDAPRYRGLHGYVHEINGGCVVVRTGEPADWARWLREMTGRVVSHRDSCHEPMTFGSLFAGIGGMDLGLERAGTSCCHGAAP